MQKYEKKQYLKILFLKDKKKTSLAKAKEVFLYRISESN